MRSMMMIIVSASGGARCVHLNGSTYKRDEETMMLDGGMKGEANKDDRREAAECDRRRIYFFL